MGSDEMLRRGLRRTSFIYRPWPPTDYLHPELMNTSRTFSSQPEPQPSPQTSNLGSRSLAVGGEYDDRPWRLYVNSSCSPMSPQQPQPIPEDLLSE